MSVTHLVEQDADVTDTLTLNFDLSETWNLQIARGEVYWGKYTASKLLLVLNELYVKPPN